MTTESVIQYLTQNYEIDKCIEKGGMKLRIHNVGVIFLFGEDTIEYYYEAPYNPMKNYELVDRFCMIAKSYIIDILKEHRINALIR